MSQTRTTATTSQYNQPSMGVFNSFQPQIQSGLSDLAQDPMKATYFNKQAQMMRQQIASTEESRNQQLMMNQRASGNMANPSAFMASQLNKNQRAGMTANAQGFNQLLMNANQVRMGALGQMQGYRPMQIGQTSKESTGGLGSWLTPLLSAVLGGGFLGKNIDAMNQAKTPLSYMPGDTSGMPTGNLPLDSLSNLSPLLMGM